MRNRGNRAYNYDPNGPNSTKTKEDAVKTHKTKTSLLMHCEYTHTINA
jgi:hypothetical protein